MGSSQYLYNAKMREEIVEQLGVTPTPGGLQKLLEQHETDRLNSYHETMESFEGDLPMGIISPPALKDVFFDPEDDSLGSLYDESIENMEGAGIGRILPTKYNPAAQGVAGISALISKIMMDGSMDKFNELGDPEDINFSPTGMANGGMADLLNQDDGFGDEESYQRALEEQAIIFAKSSPDNFDYQEAIDDMAMNIAGGHRLEKSDVIEDLEQAIAERRVIEGTPDGMSFRDRLKETFGMESGGIVSLANGGQPRFPALRDFGSTIFNATPGIIANQMTGGFFNPLRSALSYVSDRFGGEGTRERLINQIYAVGGPNMDDNLETVDNMSINDFQKATQGYAVPGSRYNEETGEFETFKTLPAQDMSARMSTASALMAMPTYGAMFNVGGSSGMGKGAGGNFGQSQRMERRERRRMRNMPIEQRLELESRGFGSGAQAARERVSANPSAGFGKPSNYDELAAYYIKHGGFDENAPVTQWGDA